MIRRNVLNRTPFNPRSRPTPTTDPTMAWLVLTGRHPLGVIRCLLIGLLVVASAGYRQNCLLAYPVACLAHANGVPFYVAAPRSTIDPACPDGASIPIEERPASEVTEGFGVRTAPEGVCVYSPAFDVTPAEIVTAIITEVGVIKPVNGAGIAASLALA